MFVSFPLICAFLSSQTVGLLFFSPSKKGVVVTHLSVGVRQELHLEVPRSRREAHDEDGRTGYLGGNLAVGGSHALRRAHLFRSRFQFQIRFQIRVGFGFRYGSVSGRFRVGFGSVSVRFQLRFQKWLGLWVRFSIRFRCGWFGSDLVPIWFLFGSFSVPIRFLFGPFSVPFRFLFGFRFHFNFTSREQRSIQATTQRTQLTQHSLKDRGRSSAHK